MCRRRVPEHARTGAVRCWWSGICDRPDAGALAWRRGPVCECMMLILVPLNINITYYTCVHINTHTSQMED